MESNKTRTGNEIMNAEEYAALIETKCLTDAGRAAPKKALAVTAPNSPIRAKLEKELAEVEARWESESPVRAARAALEAKGWKPTDRAGIWSQKRPGGQTALKKPLVEAIRLAGLAT